MGRAYACPIIGDGSEANPFRAAIAGVVGVTRCRNLITGNTSGVNRGKPINTWCIAWIEVRQVGNPPADDATVWAAIDAVSSNIHLAALDLNATAPSATVNRIRTAGFFTQQEANTVTTYRSLLELILVKMMPNGVTVEDLLAGRI